MNADQHRQREGVAIAREVAADLVAAGAQAVILTGSFARGTASGASDIDLYAIGDGLEYELTVRGGFLVSVSWRTEAQVQASFDDVASAVQAVPGWRSASVLADPRGIAENLRAAARAWSWERFEPAVIDRLAATMVTGFAEEVQKLAGAVARADVVLAAVQRSVLATRLALPLAIYHRILFESENDLWRLVGEAMGAEWVEAQWKALGIRGDSFEETCRAAITLFAMARDAVHDSMTAEQTEVTRRAIQSAREWSVRPNE